MKFHFRLSNVFRIAISLALVVMAFVFAHLEQWDRATFDLLVAVLVYPEWLQLGKGDAK